MKKRQGASLIEAAISALILSIITIPIISGFSEAYKNYIYSQDYYKAGIHAQNLLCQVIYGGSSFETIFGAEYELNKYNYTIYICEINDNGIGDYTAHSSSGIYTPLENVNFTSESPQEYSSVSSGYLVIVDVRNDENLMVRLLSPVESL